MKNKLILSIISFLVVFISVSGCIDSTSSDNSTKNINYSTNQASQDITSTKPSTSSSSSKSSGSKSIDSTVCPQCSGTGNLDCYNTVTGGPTCYGTGIVKGGPTEGSVCRVCDGSSLITCPNCNGNGYL